MSKKNSFTLVAVFVMTVISVWSSLLWTDMVSLIDYSIRDKNNEMVLGEKVALESPINHSNPLVINIEMPTMSKENLLAVINASERIEKFYAGRGIKVSVASLSTITDYKGEALDKFISVSKIVDENFDSEKWFANNANRATLRKSFLGKVGDHFYTSIIIFPDEGVDEIEVAKTFLLFKAGWGDYRFDWWKSIDGWSWKNIERHVRLNFYPKVELDEPFNRFAVKDDFGKIVEVNSSINLQPYGWTFHRLEIDAMARTGAYASLGLASVALIIFSLAALGTWRKVLVSVAVVSLAFVYAKGSIGLISRFIDLVNSYASNIGWLDWMANSFFQHSFEDVFTIEAYFALLISGISFSWHYMRKFGRVRETYSHSSHYWSAWDKAKEKVRITVLIRNIAVFDFLLSLSVANYQGARAMWQVGLVASIGILAAWSLTHYALPVLYYLIGGVGDSHRSSQGRLNKWLDDFVGSIVRRIISGWVLRRSSAVISIYLVIAMVIMATGLGPVFLKTDNDLSQFLKNAPSEQTYEAMNKRGGTGSSMFSSSVSADLYSAKALEELRQYLGSLEKSGRMTYSPLYFFIEVLEEDYGYISGSIEEKLREEAKLNLEDSGSVVSEQSVSEEVREIVKSIWGSVLDEDDGLLDHFIYLSENGSYTEIMVTSPESSTNELARFQNETLKGSVEGLSNLKISMSGKLSQYLEIDRIISNGRWLYNILSQLAIVIFCVIYFHYRNKSEKSLRWRISAGRSSVLVAVPFIWATATLYLLMMAIGMPFDIASASIGAMAVSIAVDFPLFVVESFRRVISQKEETFSREEVFISTIKEAESVNAIVDVIVDYAGNAILFAFMMATPVEAIRRLGILEEWVLLNCILCTVLLVLPMLRCAVKRKGETHIFRELFDCLAAGKKYGMLGRNHAVSASE